MKIPIEIAIIFIIIISHRIQNVSKNGKNWKIAPNMNRMYEKKKTMTWIPYFSSIQSMPITESWVIFFHPFFFTSLFFVWMCWHSFIHNLVHFCTASIRKCMRFRFVAWNYFGVVSIRWKKYVNIATEVVNRKKKLCCLPSGIRIVRIPIFLLNNCDDALAIRNRTDALQNMQLVWSYKVSPLNFG